MFKDLEKPQKIFMYILFGLTVIALAISVFVIYHLALSYRPKTLGVSYASTLTTSSGEAPICEVNIWENTKNNGQELYEIRWNSYTDAEGSWVKGFGMQIVGGNYATYRPLELVLWEQYLQIYQYGGLANNETLVIGDWYCYQDDGIGTASYGLGVDKLKNNIYIDIAEKYYQIELNSYNYQTEHYKWYGKKYYKNHTATYSWFDLSTYVINSARSSSAKTQYSTYYIDLLDCADYYHLLKQTDGKYYPLDKVTDLRNYLQIKVNYHSDGITEAEDSMFGQVRRSTNWAYYAGTEVDDFWGVTTSINLDESDITRVKDTNYISIDNTFANYLASLKNVEISININLDNLKFEATGIKMDDFIFKIKEFTISSTTMSEEDFKILNPTNITLTLNFIGGANG